MPTVSEKEVPTSEGVDGGKDVEPSRSARSTEPTMSSSDRDTVDTSSAADAAATTTNGDVERSKTSSSSSVHSFYRDVVVDLVVHAVCVLVYLVPVWTAPLDVAMLDEMFISENGDVRGGPDNPLRRVLENDYWGRSMFGPSSHKSWRPLSVVAFRYLDVHVRTHDSMFWHRLVTILIHAATAECASHVACLLFGDPSRTDHHQRLKRWSKLLFALHPSHVEAVANAANRPHVLSLLFSLVAADDRTPWPLLPLATTAAVTTCETATFHLPAVLVTSTVVRWRRRRRRLLRRTTTKTSAEETELTTLLRTLLSMIPRHVLVAAPVFVYLYLRYAYDTLDIPEGLIRPAENPFYEFTGRKRILSYSLVLSVHAAKSLLIDPLGFAHEYGYNCLPAVESFDDPRLLGPALLATAVVGTIVGSVLVAPPRRRLGSALLPAAVALSWAATLFPVSGVVKVGTFVADRIVVPSTVATTILGGRLLSGPSSSRFSRLRAVLGALALGRAAASVVRRAREWTEPYALYESALAACPDSAKSHLEMSKMFTGAAGRVLELDAARARHHLERAEAIDPDYCDVHQQFLGLLQNELVREHASRRPDSAERRAVTFEFEERLTKAVLCPFTMAGAVSQFQQYWRMATKNGRDPRATERSERHLRTINEAIENAKVEEEKKKERERTRAEDRQGRRWRWWRRLGGGGRDAAVEDEL